MYRKGLSSLLLTILCIRSACSIVDYDCGEGSDLVSPDQVKIESSCGAVSGTLSAPGNGTETVSFYITQGPLGTDNYCKIFSGRTGELLSVLTGVGEKQGPVIAQAPILYNCSLTSAHGMIMMTFQLVLFDQCGGDITVSELPVSIRQPNYPSFYPHCAYCKWEVVDVPSACELNVEFVDGYVTDRDYIYFSSEITSGIRIPDSGPNLDGRNFTLIGQNPTIEFVSDPFTAQNLEFDMLVTTSCSGPGLHCSETPTIILDGVAKGQLNVENGDTLYIAGERQADLATVADNCKMVVTDSSQMLILNFNITECAPSVNQSNDILSVTYTVWNAKALPLENEIQRYFYYCMNFTCDFNATSMVDSVALLSQIRKVEFTAAPVDGQFDVAFNLFPTDSLTSPLTSGSTINVPDFVYAKIELAQLPADATQFIVQMTDCWATDTSNSSSSRMYPIIVSGCPATNTFESPDAINVTRNYMSLYGSFAFQTFTWTNISEADQDIYVHCDVTICDNMISTCDGPMCTKRKRRQAHQDEIDANRQGGGETFSAGPIRVAPQHYEGIAPQQSDVVVSKKKEQYNDAVGTKQHFNPNNSGQVETNRFQTFLLCFSVLSITITIIALYLKK